LFNSTQNDIIRSDHLIDVLVPVFNGARTVRAAIGSIQAQTLSNIRILIVDDGSTDDTPRLLAEMAAGDSRVQVQRQPNSGIVPALNAGLAQCRAEFIARLDADDIAYPHRFEHQLAYLREHPECLAVSGAVQHIDEQGRFLGTVVRLRSPDAADANWLPAKEPYLIHSFLMARASALRAVGGYRYAVHSEDSDLYWRIQELGQMHNMEAILGEYRMHLSSISSSISNARTMALSSQLSAISALRRRMGGTDLSFPKEAIASYRAAASLREIFKLGCHGLTTSETEHLEIAVAAKLLELADYRPYELELADCRFIGTALAKRMRTANAANKAELTRLTLKTAVRLFRKGLLKEALAIVPSSQYPRVTARLAKRFVSGRFNLEVH
jgi:glycosyltransferase involved in cell wall biosynthesis